MIKYRRNKKKKFDYYIEPLENIITLIIIYNDDIMLKKLYFFVQCKYF